MSYALLEHPDQQVRLTTYRQESSGIRLSQLGSGASARIQTWPADRLSECIHESGRAHENFDFVRGLAHHAQDPEVRQAAISALLWNFPASPDGLRAWAGAPTRTQVEMLEHVSAALEGIDEPPETSQALTDMLPELDSGGMVRFARNFPSRTPASFANAIADDLLGRADRYQRDVDVLLEVLERIAPGRCGEVAKELTCRGRDAPDWAEQMVTNSAELATAVRKTLLSRLVGQPGQPLNAELLGRVAEPQTIQHLLDLLPIANQDGAGLDTQYSAVRRALQYSDGDLFLRGVLLRAQRGDERAEIATELSLLAYRSEPQHSSDRPPNWAPTVRDMESLIRACKELLEQELRDGDQDEIRTNLSLLAAASSCKHFKTFVLDAVASHLDLWSNYRERLSRTPASGPRPANPFHGQRLRSALLACGPDVVDELLPMAAHPESEVLIPEVLSDIVATHFTSGQRPPIQETVATAFARGRQAPVAVSEDARLISISRYFSEQLARRTAAFVAEGDETKRRQLAYSVGKWAAQTSRIPGQHVSAAVAEAVWSGALEVFYAVDVVRARAGYGQPVRDSQSLEQLTALLDSKDSAWSHDNEHYWIGELAAYFVCVIPDAELPKPWGTYFALWLKYSYWHAVTRACQAGGCIRAWDVLEHLIGLTDDAGETAFDTMVHLLDASTFPHLMNFIRQGTVPTEHAFRWRVGNHISHIARLIVSNSGLKQVLVDACMSSPTRSADGVAIRALARVDLNEALAYFLGAVDAGHLEGDSGWGDTELLSTFTSFRRELDESSFEVFPAACNELRAALYERAANHAASANVSRRLLADIECQRREDGRPDAELRHPLRVDGRQWMHIFDDDLRH